MAKRFDSSHVRVVNKSSNGAAERVARTLIGITDEIISTKQYNLVRNLPDGSTISFGRNLNNDRYIYIDSPDEDDCEPIVLDKPGIMIIVSPIEGPENDRNDGHIWWWDKEQEAFVEYFSKWDSGEQFIFNNLNWEFIQGKAPLPADMNVHEKACSSYVHSYIPYGSCTPFINSTANESTPVAVECNSINDKCAYDWRVFTQTQRYYVLGTTWYFYQPLLSDVYANYKLEAFYEGVNNYDLVGTTMIKKSGGKNWLVRILAPFVADAAYGRFIPNLNCLVEVVEVNPKTGEVDESTRAVVGNFTINISTFTDGRDTARYNATTGLRLHYKGIFQRAAWSTGDFALDKYPGELSYTAKGAWILKQTIYDFEFNHTFDFGLKGGRGSVIRVMETAITYDKDTGTFDISNREVEAKSSCVGRIRPVEVNNNVTQNTARYYYGNSYSQLYEDLYWFSNNSACNGASLPSSTYIERNWTTIDSRETIIKDYGFEGFTRDYALAVGYISGELNTLRARLINIGERERVTDKHHKADHGYDCRDLSTCARQSVGTVSKTEIDEERYPGIKCTIYDNFKTIFEEEIYSESARLYGNFSGTRTLYEGGYQGLQDDEQSFVLGSSDIYYNNIEFLKVDPQNQFYAFRHFSGKSVNNTTTSFSGGSSIPTTKTKMNNVVFTWTKKVKFYNKGEEVYLHLEENGTADETVELAVAPGLIDTNMYMDNFGVTFTTTNDIDSCGRQYEYIDVDGYPSCSIVHQYMKCPNYASYTSTGSEKSTTRFTEVTDRNPMAPSCVNKYATLKSGKVSTKGYAQDATSFVDFEHFEYIDYSGFIQNAQFVSYDGDLAIRTHGTPGGQLKDKKTYITADLPQYVYSLNGDWAVVFRKYVGDTHYEEADINLTSDIFAERSTEYEYVLIINGTEYPFSNINDLTALGIKDFKNKFTNSSELQDGYNIGDDVPLNYYNLTGF